MNTFQQSKLYSIKTNWVIWFEREKNRNKVNCLCAILFDAFQQYQRHQLDSTVQFYGKSFHKSIGPDSFTIGFAINSPYFNIVNIHLIIWTWQKCFLFFSAGVLLNEFFFIYCHHRRSSSSSSSSSSNKFFSPKTRKYFYLHVNPKWPVCSSYFTILSMSVRRSFERFLQLLYYSWRLLCLLTQNKWAQSIQMKQ